MEIASFEELTVEEDREFYGRTPAAYGYFTDAAALNGG